MSSLGQRLLAELVGTYALMFAACGSVMAEARGAGIGLIGIALTTGLAVAVLVASLGHVSGAHLNPAVTFAFLLTGRFPPAHVLPYCAAQVIGGALATLTLRASLGDVGGIGATTPIGSAAQALLWEIVLTAFLVLVVMGVATDARAVGQLAAAAIGAVVTLAIMVGGNVSGAAISPVRALSPVLAGGPREALWVYLVGPLTGAALAVGLYSLLRAPAHGSER